MAEHDRGHRAPFRAYGGDGRLEIVSGKSFSATQSAYLATTGPHHCRDDPPPRRASGHLSSSSHYSSSSSSSSMAATPWCFSDPEAKRRRRVAAYKVYGVEGKVKASLRKSLRWIKGKCSQITRGW